MRFEPGQRVVLVRTTDPHTHLRPGDQGTVRRHNTIHNIVDVDWDAGSRLSILLDGGDGIAPVPPAAGDSGTSPQRMLLHEVRVVGADDGAAAAGEWLRDTVGEWAVGDPVMAARRTLDAIADGDPAELETLPEPDTWAADAERSEAPSGWKDTVAAIRDAGRPGVVDAYRDGVTQAVAATVLAGCRRRLLPTGQGRDLSHLHPDHVALGGAGVFAGDWDDGPVDGGYPVTVGYVGTLIDRWNGWAVFTCTRTVAEAIVAEHVQFRNAYRAQLAAAGAAEPGRETDGTYSRMWWNNDVIVVDSTAVTGDPDAIELIEPDAAGRYVVMGWTWCWQAVDPYDCARVVGDLPDSDRSQEWVLLTHAPYIRVAPQPYAVTNLQHHATLGYSGVLSYRGDPVATVIGITGPGAPSDPGRRPARLTVPGGRFNPSQWQAYVAAARRCGEPMTEADVLTALAHDTLIGRSAADTVAGGDALVRLLADTGTIRALLRVSPAPGTPEAFAVMRDQLRTGYPDPHGVTWQYWNGNAWRHLTTADAGNDTSQPPPAWTRDTATG